MTEAPEDARPVTGAVRGRYTLLLLAGVAALCLSILELGLRVAFGNPPTWRYPQERYEPDPELGYRLAPGQRAFTIDQPVSTNALGLRDSELAAGRDADLRILAVGDSQTFGVGVAAENTWPEQLAQLLENRLTGCRVDALNAGLPASATWREEGMVRRLLPRYRPHVVVVGFYVNDVFPASKRAPFSLDESRERGLRRYVELALKRSATVLAVRNAVRSLRGRSGAAEYEDAVVADAPHPTKDAGWEQVRRSLAAIRDAARSDGAGLVVLAMPRIDQVDGRNPAHGVQDRLLALGRDLGIEVVDALPVLKEAAEREGTGELTVPWDGHFASRGQALMANAVAERLVALGYLGGCGQRRAAARQTDARGRGLLP